MVPDAVKLLCRRLKTIYAARPRSMLEWYEFTRDDIVLAPFFQVCSSRFLETLYLC